MPLYGVEEIERKHMSIVLPMVKESQTSGGTGNLTGCAAVTNYWRGDTAPGGALNRRYKYWILESSLHEFGIGYKSATGTFVRETVLGNSSGTTGLRIAGFPRIAPASPENSGLAKNSLRILLSSMISRRFDFEYLGIRYISEKKGAGVL